MTEFRAPASVAERELVEGLEAMSRNEDPTQQPDRQAALFAALAAAQAQFPPIKKDKTVDVKTKNGGTYTFLYAPLETILAAVRPALADNGLAVTQTFRGFDMVTTLLHRDGGIIESVLPLERAGGSWQEFGSAITYCRRYALISILGVASEDDDDGNGADGNIVVESTGSLPATEEQVDEYIALVAAAGFDVNVARNALVKDSGGEPVLLLVLQRHRRDLEAEIAKQEADPP